jgi:hypothetical protein
LASISSVDAAPGLKLPATCSVPIELPGAIVPLPAKSPAIVPGVMMMGRREFVQAVAEHRDPAVNGEQQTSSQFLR